MRGPMIRTLVSVPLLCMALLTGNALAADSVGEPGRVSRQPNPLKNVYFGEQHMHTQNSFDAWTVRRSG